MFQELENFKKVRVIFDNINKYDGEARFVGGCVRDSIIGKKIQDIDIATTLHPDKIEHIFSSIGHKTIDIGKSFGTVIVVIDEYPYEITTLRKDIETDGRKATSIEYTGNWDEDALRRDFTINAMSYCPFEHKLYDYFDGKEHLREGIVKFVGEPEERVKEDFLRIMRFFRFYTYYGKKYNIHQDSLEACVNYAKNLKLLSGERKYNELFKILSHKDRVETLELMSEYGILVHLFNHSIENKSIVVLNDAESKANAHDIELSNIFVLFVISKLNNIQAKYINELFRLSNKEYKHIKSLYELSDLSSEIVKKNLNRLVYTHKDILLENLVYLFALDKTKSDASNLIAAAKEVLSRDIKDFPIKGRDVIEMFHIDPSPRIKELMDIAEEYWFNSSFSATKEELLEHVNNTIRNENEQ